MPNSLVDYRRSLPYSTRSHSCTLQVPFACTTSCFNFFFCEALQLWTSYRLRSSHLRLLPPLRDNVCFFTLNNTYSSCYVSFVFCFLSTWSVAISTPATHVSYVLYMNFTYWTLKCSSQDKPAALTSYERAPWGAVILDYYREIKKVVTVACRLQSHCMQRYSVLRYKISIWVGS